MVSYELELQIEQSNQLKNDVIRLTAEGKKPSEIQQETGLSLKEQREINAEFRAAASNDFYIRQRAKELIAYVDQHYAGILQKFYEVEKNAQLANDDKLRADVLTRIVNTENARVAFMQKAGMLSENSISDDLVEMEAKQDEIISILKELNTKFPDAGNYIRERLMQLEGKVPSERIE